MVACVSSGVMAEAGAIRCVEILPHPASGLVSGPTEEVTMTQSPPRVFPCTRTGERPLDSARPERGNASLLIV